MSHNIKKDLIYQAGFELFGEFSPKRVTIDMIVKKAGIAKGTFYLYYKNKEELYESIVGSIMEQGRVMMSNLAATIPDVKQRFLVHMVGSLEFMQKNLIIKNLIIKNENYYVGGVNFDNLYSTHVEFMKILMGVEYKDKEFIDLVSNMKGFYMSVINSKGCFSSDQEYYDFAMKLAIILIEGMFCYKTSGLSDLSYKDISKQFNNLKVNI